ncbi:hypothetical protein B9Z55_027366 [Caenorhabditis nigoni]|uniref:HTH CENPB-type domain-containing protein n=1 Tax=Caenorhabditis nigoni TaxID=1611254 RepID=A0A2G5SG90_9PELO|nr:hypothetical protein B9Z55_027366 [Caenorhabditis nigoni]
MEKKSLCREDARHTPYKNAPARQRNDLARRIIRRTPDVEAVMPTAEEKKSLLEKAYAEEKQQLEARKVEEEKAIESPGHIAGKGEHLVNTIYKNIVKLKEALGESAKECMINNVLEFASAILGVDRSTVVAHANKIPASPPSRVPQTRKYRRERAAGMMSVEDKRAIMEHMQFCWKNDQFVSLKGLLKWARSSINYQYGLSTLGCALAGMGFCYRQKSHNPIIEERRDLIFLTREVVSRQEKKLARVLCNIMDQSKEGDVMIEETEEVIDEESGDWEPEEFQTAIDYYRNTTKGFRSLDSMKSRFRWITESKHIDKLRAYEKEKNEFKETRTNLLRFLSNRLFEVVKDKLKTGFSLHDLDLQRFALHINNKETKIQGFKASESWITSWKKAHRVLSDNYMLMDNILINLAPSALRKIRSKIFPKSEETYGPT